MRRTVAVCATALFCCALAEAALTLVQDGKSQCAIVVNPAGGAISVLSNVHSPNLTYGHSVNVLSLAAEELAEHLHEMAGIWAPAAKIRIVDSPKQAKTKVRILLGAVAVEEHGLQGEAAALPYPAYVHRVVGHDLLIFGSSAKGTANGVYGFLQDELGVRWFGPQDLFRIVPERKTIAVEGGLDKRVAPSFPGRKYHVSSRREDPACHWGRRRMRMAEPVDNREPFTNASHYMFRMFPAHSRYPEEHPEYYWLRGRKRALPLSRGDGSAWNMCFSNPEVVDVSTRLALSRFRANKHNHSFALGINDTSAYCECRECEVRSVKTRFFRGKRVASDNYFAYVNEVARRVSGEFPDRCLGVIAYNDVTAPPLGPVEKNVHVVVVSDVSEYFDPGYRQRDEELLRAWQAKGVTLGLYFYEGLAKLVPAYFPRLVAEQLREKHNQGVTSLICEVYPGWPWTGPMAYVTAQLWWHVDLDVGELLNEYFTELYGPAAEPMGRLYDLFERIHMRPRRGGFLYEHYKFLQFRPYTLADLERMRALLAEAHRLAPAKSKEARRVGYVSNGLQVFMTMLEAHRKAEGLTDPAELTDAGLLMRVLDLDRIGDILDSHDALYRETIMNDRFQSRRYTRDTCLSVRREWNNTVASALGRGFADLAQRSQDAGLHPQVKARLDAAIARHCRDPLRQKRFMVRTGTAELGPNLMGNPGFEAVWGEGEHAECDPAVKGVGHGWNAPPTVRAAGGMIDATDQDPHGGLRAGRICGPAPRAYYLRHVPKLKPGEFYLCEAYAKSLSRSPDTRVSLLVRWWGKGWMWGAPQYRAELQQTGEWERLEALALVPEGATSAAVFLSVERLDDGDEVFFDDVSVRKVTGEAK